MTTLAPTTFAEAEYLSILSSSPVLSLFYAYIGGVLSSFTPCVYPMIPITLSIVGAHGAKNRGSAFGCTSVYVAGMIITYTLLGIVSARIGALFGSVFQQPVLIASFSLLIALFALNELDIINLNFWSRFQRKAQNIGGGKSLFGIFIMGSVSGMVAAPCIGPVLATILGVIATSGDPFLGGLLMVSYSIGLGTILLFIGTFSHFLTKLPRSGNWLYIVKSLLGISLLIVALLFIERLIGLNTTILSLMEKLPTNLLNPLFLFIAVLNFLIVIKSYKSKLTFLRLSGSLICATCLVLVYSGKSNLASPTNSDREIAMKFYSSIDDALAEGISANKPVVVDFHAEWCSACQDLERFTLADNSVKRELNESWVVSRVDLTETSETTEEIQQKYSIYGLPTILFFKKGETTPTKIRITEFVEPKEFLQILERISNSP